MNNCSSTRQEEIQRRLEAIQRQREEDERRFEALRKQLQDEEERKDNNTEAIDARIEATIAATTGKHPAEQKPIESLLINGKELNLGDRVAVVEESATVGKAEMCLGKSRDLTKLIYLGERGKVIELVESFHGVPGAKIRFIDGAERFFFESCLQHGDYLKGGAASSLSTSTTTTTGQASTAVVSTMPAAAQSTSTSSGTIPPPPPAHAAPLPCTGLPVQRPKRVTKLVSNFVASSTSAAVDADDDENDKENLLQLKADEEVRRLVEQQRLQKAAAAEKKPTTTTTATTPQQAQVDSSPSASTRAVVAPSASSSAVVKRDALHDRPQSQQPTTTTGAGGEKKKIPHCPTDYAAKHPIATTKTGISRLGANASGTAASQPSSSSTAKTPSSATAGKPAAQGRSRGNSLTENTTSKQSSTSAVAAATKTPTKATPEGTHPPAAAAAKKASPALPLTMPSVKSCTLYAAEDYDARIPVAGKVLIVKDSCSSMTTLLSLVTRSLGWNADGRRAERVFGISTVDPAEGSASSSSSEVTTNALTEILSPSQIQHGMKLVATTGNDFTLSASKKQQGTSAATTASKKPATTNKAALTTVSSNKGATSEPQKTTTSSVQKPRVVAAPSTTTTAAAGLAKPVTLKVFENGSYGDANDRVPYRTITVRKTHKSIQSVKTIVTQELSWSMLGRKAEVLYDPVSGAEINSLDVLSMCSSVVASSGDRFIPPHPNSLLGKEVAAEGGGAVVAVAQSSASSASSTVKKTTLAAKSPATTTTTKRPTTAEPHVGSKPTTGTSTPSRARSPAPSSSASATAAKATTRSSPAAGSKSSAVAASAQHSTAASAKTAGGGGKGNIAALMAEIAMLEGNLEMV